MNMGLGDVFVKNLAVDSSGLTQYAGTSGGGVIVFMVSLPTFSKSFTPDSITAGELSTLTFTIDNTNSGAAASRLDFGDTLPADVVIATPNNAVIFCTGGTPTAPVGAGVITYSGGMVAVGASCTLSVDVTRSTAGMHVNTTGDLISSLGNSGTANDTADGQS